MLPFFKKRVLGIGPKPVAVPVVATAFASPVPLLARDARNLKKVVDTSTVFNQFEQLRKFQHINSTPDKASEGNTSSSKRHNIKIPWALLILVAIVSSITASVVVLAYSAMNLPKQTLDGFQVPQYADASRDAFSQARRHCSVPALPAHSDRGHAMIGASEALPQEQHYAKILKVIQVRGDRVLSNDRKSPLVIDHQDPKDKPSPVGVKVKAKRYVLRIAKAVSDVFMAPLELRHEVDFNFN